MHALDKLEAESGQRADSTGPSESDKTWASVLKLCGR